jgi:hypothetical protein
MRFIKQLCNTDMCKCVNFLNINILTKARLDEYIYIVDMSQSFHRHCDDLYSCQVGQRRRWQVECVTDVI